jgi:alkyl hydroperoxide reductase subunit F
MLEQALKEQLKSIFGGLQSRFILRVLADPAHAAKAELVELLNDVASCSDKIEVVVVDGVSLSFSILKNDVESSFKFRAVPNGHEFTTLLMAILNMDGIGKNIPDEAIIQRIKSLKGEVRVKSYISLTCTNCPDVAQAINVMSIFNPNIQHEIIDGGINQQEVEKLNIQAVPAVFVNDELVHVGRAGLGELLTKIEEKAGSDFEPASTEVKAYDAIVAGGGPAGVSAAIYLVRKGLSVALVADKVGGQVTETVGIENMISVPQTTGNQLVANLKSHLKEYPVEILENRKIEEVSLQDGVKVVKTSLGEILTSPALIIATGASWRRLGVAGENEYIGSGVAFCAHCDGPFYKGKKVAVVGGGNSGLEAAIDLSAIASNVTVLEYLHELKGDQILQDKIKNIPNIQVITGAETLVIEGDGAKVNALQYKMRESGETARVNLDGVFVQIGLKANSQIFSHLVEVNKFGEIIIDSHCRTNVPGVYAAGDVSVVPYKQIVIAMGEGSKAALSAFEDKLKDKLLAN